MNKIIKKILSILLTLVVMIGILPTMKVGAATYSYATEYDWLSSDVISNCVAFARYKVPSLPSGLTYLSGKKSIINSHTPAVGAIAITTGNNATYGHVAYVEAVNGTQITTLNGGYKDCTHIGRIVGTEAEQGILGYWYPEGVTSSNLVGYLDSYSGDYGSVYVKGWAADKTDLAKSIEVHVYIGGPAENPNSEGHIVQANKLRTDVNDVMGYGNYHGYEQNIPTSLTGQQDIYVYALNPTTGENTFIDSGTVNIIPTNLVGYLDSHTEGPGYVEVYGWTLDKSNGSDAIEAHVYIGGPAGTGELHRIVANKERTDIVSLGYGIYHGYWDKVYTDMYGEQEMYTYSVNMNTGEYMLIDYRTVNIPKNIVPTGLVLNTNNITLTTKGNTSTLTATVSPTNAADKTVTWKSSNTSVATVSTSGEVTAVGNGTATITATTNSGGKIATCTVTVEIKPTFTYGDANNDTKINVMDAVLMKKHIAGYENLTINLDACDVNVDTKVNVMDTVMLLKYVAGFDVTLGK